MFLESNRFSLSFWHDYKLERWGEFHVIRLRPDWFFGQSNVEGKYWVSLDASLLGLNLSLTFWPQGKEWMGAGW